VVWEVVHLRPMASGSSMTPVGLFQDLEVEVPNFLAIFPDAGGEAQVELFLAPDADQGELGKLTGGFIVWNKGGYSKLEFPAVRPSVHPGSRKVV